MGANLDVPMWMLALALAADCPPVDELPAAIASVRAWPDRIAKASCTERDEAEQERAGHVAEVLAILQERQPNIERGPLRGLVDAAGSEDGRWVEQARRAARLEWILPERDDDSDWFAAVPVPVPAGTPLVLADVDGLLADVAEDVASRAGFAVGSDGPSLSLSAKNPEPARWGKARGYAVEVIGTSGDVSVSVDGFAVGPLAQDTRRRLFETAVAQILGVESMLKVLAPDVVPGPDPTTGALERTDASELCVLRRPDNADLPVRLKIGPSHELLVPTASYGCMELPIDMSIRSPYGSRTLGEGTLLVELSDRGESKGRFRILDGDPEVVEKLQKKGKLEAWEPEARAVR